MSHIFLILPTIAIIMVNFALLGSADSGKSAFASWLTGTEPEKDYVLNGIDMISHGDDEYLDIEHPSESNLCGMNKVVIMYSDLVSYNKAIKIVKFVSDLGHSMIICHNTRRSTIADGIRLGNITALASCNGIIINTGTINCVKKFYDNLNKEPLLERSAIKTFVGGLVLFADAALLDNAVVNGMSVKNLCDMVRMCPDELSNILKYKGNMNPDDVKYLRDNLLTDEGKECLSKFIE
jgi:hypothetical protein